MTRLNGRASWIWDAGEARPLNRYLYLRRRFELADASVDAAVAHVCADEAYKLYVNGRFVHHGPARSDVRHRTYDSYDLRPYLMEGENVVAALVHFPGIGTCASMIGRAGFLLECAIGAGGGETGAGGGETVVGTDASWRVSPAPYGQGYDRMSVQLPYPEDFDAACEPVGWNDAGYDDSAWAPATVIGPVGTEPWGAIEPRDIPLQRYHEIVPESLLPPMACNPLDPAGSTAPRTPAEAMERATTLTPARRGAVTLVAPGHVVVQPSAIDGDGISLVFDFGREVSGFPSLEILRSGSGRLDIGYSERIEDDGTVNPNHFGGCDVHYADRLRLRPGAQTWTAFAPRAFRYVRIDVHDTVEPLEFRCALDYFAYPVENRGLFACSDPLLNRIWEVGRYTAELCMDDAYMDCPWRERGQWLADARNESLVAAYAFGDVRLARRAWRQFGHSQGATDAIDPSVPSPPHHALAWIKCLYPSAPPFDTVLPTFNCLWISGLWDYFRLTADRSLLAETWPVVTRLLDLLASHESAGGLIHNLPGWVFVDWAKLDVRGEACHVNAFYYAALRDAARIARTLGHPERGGELEMHASDVREAINDLLWDRERGLYADARLPDGTLSPTISEQANVLCMLYEIAERDQAERILSTFYGDGEPPADTVRIATPYFAFYLLRALYARGRHALALDYTRRQWGRMLARGATTFWEQFEPLWSLCHAWSSAPTYDLPAEVAGIRPTQPGFEEFIVDLRPTDLTWLRAIVPSVRGDIEIGYHFRTDLPYIDSMGTAQPLAWTAPAITVSLRVPAGTRAHVRIPLADIATPTVRVNGAPAWASGAAQPDAPPNAALEDGIFAFDAAPGDWLVEIERQYIST